MLLKNHLIEVFKKASLENNFLLKENVVLKWVHRFGIDSLNDLLIHTPVLGEYQLEEENQEQISLIDELGEEENQEQITLIDELDEEEHQEQITLMDEVGEEENQEQIKLESSKTFENIEETKWETNGLETASGNGISIKNQNHNKINQFTETPKLPLPYIKNLRKWINNDKKAS
ncbi:glycoprotein [uncultured Prochlorococcus sp.]|uniref:glycoprotein n=1 Tax=uncultured Prochlorococcus sp. TaxID=159733 RepID=UPI002583D67C|nr:glycoprotein [uncultured Prochlorococcus sp.]